ncbi:hypothetical protein N7532_011268 [Penicillium argentinense]|uniref:5-Methylcytosine G/T mismatch-specific DNA glycosylase n=1 Tax=Penicillium argentinense TaxID=1131581 RepID=A0A9W9EIB8_9EURO|nr:uncharacterized protein N7532_011268 [Penicillium argentinense]KAJ5082225.1 hypothetical protein N7532_011268 [Penicillium argentinense]
MFFPVRPNQPKKSKSSSKTTITTKNGLKRSSHGRSSRVSTKDPEPEPTAGSSTSSISHTAPHRRASMPGVDTASRSGTASFLESRTSLPYPSFSKAHSKEDVRKANIPTPDPTDLTEQQDDGKANGGGQDRPENHHAPPSPPLTGLDDQPSSRRGSPVVGEDEKGSDKDKEKEKEKAKKANNIKIRAEVNRSSSSLRSKRDEGTKTSKTARADTPKSKSSKTEKESSSRSSHKSSSKSKPGEKEREKERKPAKRSSRSTMSPSHSNITVRDVGVESVNGSDATSIAPNQQYTAPRKPTTPPTKPPSRNQVRSSMSHRHAPSDDSIDYGRPIVSSPGFGAPPPPPPPPEMPVSIPRVDYLLKDGGLDNKVPRTLLGNTGVPDPFASNATQPQLAAARVFDPYNRLLDEYQKVMSKNGSLAVATGYRSVARRLLDRLEAVFARDISSEPCSCFMCDRQKEEPQEGVSWGEVLELVSGRRELPMWPPFIMAPSNMDSDIPSEEHIPMQKLDVDVPEEYRDHFIRQSRKTKVAVDKWLSEQNDDQVTSAPMEVDDETLTFAMLTHLESHQRSLFCSLLGINSSTPVPRSGDEKPRQKPPALVSSSLAIQRLYRLSSLPRDPETAMFMLNNPNLHHVLATLAAISDDEWEILISGRFDGFLRSGAEDNIPPSGPRWNGSRSNTPFSTGGISRGPTPNYMDGSFRPASVPNGGPSSPASFGGPIALDEEQEIAALAEVERDIFLGMEALEDAFEALHLKAEVVRRALRERGAGLSVANQSRRGSYVEARMGTPFSNAWESGTDDGFLDDDRSLAPDDSASNISSNRRRRPKRRTERRTPAPVEEEDEESDREYAARRDSRNSRRK